MEGHSDHIHLPTCSYLSDLRTYKALNGGRIEGSGLAILFGLREARTLRQAKSEGH